MVFLSLLFCRVNAKYASKEHKKNKYLKKCHYHEEKDPYCPNFRLGYIANQARENFSELCRTVSMRLSVVGLVKTVSGWMEYVLPLYSVCLIFHTPTTPEVILVILGPWVKHRHRSCTFFLFLFCCHFHILKTSEFEGLIFSLVIGDG